MVNVLAGLLPGDWHIIHTLETDYRLNKGDKIHFALFDQLGDLPELSFEYEVAQACEGEPHVWPKLLCEHINKHFKVLQAGRHYPEIGIVPSYGQNSIFALQASGIVSVDVRFVHADTCRGRQVVLQQLYDYVFPQYRSDYRAGDRVYHSKTDAVYMCRPWPYTEFCRLGEHMDEQYEPGLGKNWPLAWQRLE